MTGRKMTVKLVMHTPSTGIGTRPFAGVGAAYGTRFRHGPWILSLSGMLHKPGRRSGFFLVLISVLRPQCPHAPTGWQSPHGWERRHYEKQTAALGHQGSVGGTVSVLLKGRGKVMVMCRNQQDRAAGGHWQQRDPGRVDGANRESPGRLAHVLLMGSGKWSKRSHVWMGAWTCRHADTQDTQDTIDR